MKYLHKITFTLLIAGALNWLITAFVSGWDLAGYLGGTGAQILYAAVGLSALYEIVTHMGRCKECGGKK